MQINGSNLVFSLSCGLKCVHWIKSITYMIKSRRVQTSDEHVLRTMNFDASNFVHLRNKAKGVQLDMGGIDLEEK